MVLMIRHVLTFELNNLNPCVFTGVVLLGVVLYGYISFRSLTRKPSRLWLCASVILVLASILFWDQSSNSGVQGVFAKLVLSVTSAINLFFFKAIGSLGNLNNYYYVPKDSTSPVDLNLFHARLVLQQGLFLCAIWTSGLLIIHLFARRIISWWWLLIHRPRACHVFLGINSYSVKLASTLPKDNKRIIFVEFPSSEVHHEKLSFLRLMRGVKLEASRSVLQMVPRAVILSAWNRQEDCGFSHDFFKDMWLKRLENHLKEKDSFLYLLSDDFKANISTLQKVDSIPCGRIFCHAPSEGINARIPVIHGRVQLIDSSVLATNRMKMNADILPVRYVDVGRDAQVEPLGWVKGPFHAMILGYGVTGKGALDFLYEFAAFVGEDRKRVPFSCDVYDRNADKLSGEFWSSHPAVPKERIQFIQKEVGTYDFWVHFMKKIKQIQYIVIALDKDAETVNTALTILEKAVKTRKETLDKLCIVVKLDDEDTYGQMLDYYQRCFHVNCIHRIGNFEKDWSWGNISNQAFDIFASQFYDAYRLATNPDAPDWEGRRRDISDRNEVKDPKYTALWKWLEIRRKEAQDYSNHWHVQVKKALCPEKLYSNTIAADSIPAKYEDVLVHTTLEQQDERDMLEYLAIGEHIRWTAAHEIAGYEWGEVKEEDLKRHPDMVDYSCLSENIKHYDWAVVKTTLSILYKEG